MLGNILMQTYGTKSTNTFTGETNMRERDKVFAVLSFDGERQDTELTIEDCPPVNYPILGRARGGQMEHDTRSCHFAPWEPGCCAGEILPVDADHPANATLTWTWDNPKYKGA